MIDTVTTETLIYVFFINFCILYIIVLLAVSKEDKLFVAITSISFSFVSISALYMLNLRIPFSGWGDDRNYYEFTTIYGNDIGQIIRDVQVYFEQGGYPIFLWIVGRVFDNSLLLLKAINVFFLVCNAIVWYRIGKFFDDYTTPKAFYIANIVATPLWFYFIFLLKDTTIILITSLLLYYTIKVAIHNRGTVAVLICIVGVGLFRVPLVVLNAALVVSFLVMLRKMDLRAVAAGGVIFGVANLLFAQPHILSSLGVFEERAISAQKLSETLTLYRQEAQRSLGFHVLSYFVMETAGFRILPSLTANWLRGAAALPWIFIGLPFFFAGCYKLLSRFRESITTRDGQLTICLLMVVVAYLAVALASNDTTRWRMPGFPAMVAVAALGWLQLKEMRYAVLFGGIVVGAIAVSAFYLLRQ